MQEDKSAELSLDDLEREYMSLKRKAEIIKRDLKEKRRLEMQRNRNEIIDVQRKLEKLRGISVELRSESDMKRERKLMRKRSELKQELEELRHKKWERRCKRQFDRALKHRRWMAKKFMRAQEEGLAGSTWDTFHILI